MDHSTVNHHSFGAGVKFPKPPFMSLSDLDRPYLQSLLDDNPSLLDELQIDYIHQLDTNWYGLLKLHLQQKDVDSFTEATLVELMREFILRSRFPQNVSYLQKWTREYIALWMIQRPHVFYVRNLPSVDDISLTKALYAVSHLKSLSMRYQTAVPATVIDQVIIRCIT